MEGLKMYSIRPVAIMMQIILFVVSIMYNCSKTNPAFSTSLQSLARFDGFGLLVTDHEWNKAGNKLVVLIQPVSENVERNAEIWLLELPQFY